MRVALVRTGGFANVRVEATLAAERLSAEERAALDALLARPAGGEAVAGPPDRFVYELRVARDGSDEHRVRFGEAELDDTLRPLVDRLERAAAPA